MASIQCPNCRQKVALKSPAPGHYRPACPACQVKFDLLIPNDPAEPPRATPIKPRPPSAPVAQTAVNPPAAVKSSSVAPARVDRTQFFIAESPQIAYDDLHGRLGGYELVRKLGQGGMGSVYLARQVSLDREVAVKTLSPTLAGDPQFVARFTREAYAAAQLNHHNVVQIHDIGQDRGTNFFSMELVDGTNLADIVEREGRLDPMTAVNYVLQAARGLRFSHEHGLIHRDVKPENLLLNNAGVVKVADLGLVKRAGAKELGVSEPGRAGPISAASPNVTQLNTSMGTPAYMAPEQARDAAKVDARADIYSLGCTLYDLVTGRPPFSGKTAIEVITKHQTQPIVPPEKIVANLPPRLSEIIRKMTAKQPEERYASMAQVVKDLEDFLGVEHDATGAARASQDNVKRIEVAVAGFNAAPFAAIRRNGILAFYVGCLIAFGIGCLTLSPWLAGGSIAFAVLATIAYQLTVGLKNRTPIFVKTRQLIFGASVFDWLTWLLGAAVVVLLLYFFGQLWVWLGVMVLAAFAGMAFHFGIDNVVSVQREEPLKDMDQMIREMRLRGVDEDAIRGFIARFSGRNWEEFYEALFGYDAKIDARRLYGKGERGRERKRFAVWRDWIIAWIDQKLADRKADRERRLLARLEARALEARGVASNVATRQAKESAQRVVDRARTVKDTHADRRLAETAAPTARAQPSNVTIHADWMHVEDEDGAVAESLDGYEKTSYFRRRFGGPLDILFGRRVRLLLAALLLLGSGRWVQMNGVEILLDNVREIGTGMQQAAADIQNNRDNAAREGVAPNTPATPPSQSDVGPKRVVKPLEIPGVPRVVCDVVGSPNGLVAGFLLLLSVPLYGHLMSITVLLGAAITLLGQRYSLPVLGPVPWWLALIAGGAVSLFGMLFLRRTTD